MLTLLIIYSIVCYAVHGYVTIGVWIEDKEMDTKDAIWLAFAPVSIVLYLILYVYFIYGKSKP
jgi:hypothetical protein